MYSNKYIFIYSSIMVIIVAAILSTAAMLLKPFQDRNIAVEKMRGILSSANIGSTTNDAIKLYDKYIKEEIVIDASGEIVSNYENGSFTKGDIRAFDIDLKKELYNKSKKLNYFLPLLVCEKDGKKIYIIPLYGKGLWGPIWGYFALSDDYNKVVGVTFAHKGETPGLGAEIDTKAFQQQFVGKQIFNDKGDFTSIKVVKGGIDLIPENIRKHGVDAISGGTITSNSVSDMLNDCLENYLPYIKKQK